MDHSTIILLSRCMLLLFMLGKPIDGWKDHYSPTYLVNSLGSVRVMSHLCVLKEIL